MQIAVRPGCAFTHSLAFTKLGEEKSYRKEPNMYFSSQGYIFIVTLVKSEAVAW